MRARQGQQLLSLSHLFFTSSESASLSLSKKETLRSRRFETKQPPAIGSLASERCQVLLPPADQPQRERVDVLFCTVARPRVTPNLFFFLVPSPQREVGRPRIRIFVPLSLVNHRQHRIREGKRGKGMFAVHVQQQGCCSPRPRKNSIYYHTHPDGYNLSENFFPGAPRIPFPSWPRIPPPAASSAGG